MADTKISALTAVASVAGANEFAVNEASVSKKASATQVQTFVHEKSDNVRVLGREATLITIVSSVTETDIFNFTVPANVMSTNRVARLTLIGDRLNNSGANEVAVTYRVYIGGTLRYEDAGAVLGANAQRIPFLLNVFLAMQNASNVMVMGGHMLLGSVAATTGIGNAATDEISTDAPFGTSGTFTQDTTIAFAVRVTVQLGSNLATVDFRRQYAVLELV